MERSGSHSLTLVVGTSRYDTVLQHEVHSAMKHTLSILRDNARRCVDLDVYLELWDLEYLFRDSSVSFPNLRHQELALVSCDSENRIPTNAFRALAGSSNLRQLVRHDAWIEQGNLISALPHDFPWAHLTGFQGISVGGGAWGALRYAESLETGPLHFNEDASSPDTSEFVQLPHLKTLTLEASCECHDGNMMG